MVTNLIAGTAMLATSAPGTPGSAPASACSGLSSTTGTSDTNGESTTAPLASPHLHQPAEHLVVERLGLRHRHLHAAEPVPVAAHVDAEPGGESERRGVRPPVIDVLGEVGR